MWQTRLLRAVFKAWRAVIAEERQRAQRRQLVDKKRQQNEAIPAAHKPAQVRVACTTTAPHRSGVCRVPPCPMCTLRCTALDPQCIAAYRRTAVPLPCTAPHCSSLPDTVRLAAPLPRTAGLIAPSHRPYPVHRVSSCAEPCHIARIGIGMAHRRGSQPRIAQQSQCRRLRPCGHRRRWMRP